MYEFTPDQEAQLQQFKAQLECVQTVDDIIPPDDEGVREPRREPKPTLPGSACLCLDVLTGVLEGRQRRQLVAAQTGLLLDRMETLVGA